VSHTTRIWMALASLGAGLVHLAIGAGSPLSLAIFLIGFGVAEIVWGLSIMARAHTVLPRTVMVASLIPVALWALLLTVLIVAGSSSLASTVPLLPMAVGSLLNLYVSGSLAVARRRFDRESDAAASVSSTTWADAAAGQPQAGRYVLGLVFGALLVSGMVTPALAATNAGQYAVPHGSHGFDVTDGGHSNH
jgi:hypothetical protein